MDTPVVHIVDRLQPTAGVQLALRLCRSPWGRGNALFICLDKTVDTLTTWPELVEPLQHITGRMISLSGNRAAALPELSNLLRRVRARTVHVHSAGALLVAGSAAKVNGARLFFSAYDDIESRLDPHPFHLFNPRVIVDGRWSAEALRHWLPLPGVETVPPGVDLDADCPGDAAAARRDLDLPEQGHLIGLFTDGIDAQTLSRVLIAHAGAGSRHTLVLVTRRANRGALEKALTGQIGEQVPSSASGTVLLAKDDASPQVLQALDLLLMPARMAFRPYLALRAQACGLPVLAAREATSPDFLCPSGPAPQESLSSDLMAETIRAVVDGRCVGSGPPVGSPELVAALRSFVADIADMTRACQAVTALYQG